MVDRDLREAGIEQIRKHSSVKISTDSDHITRD